MKILSSIELNSARWALTCPILPSPWPLTFPASGPETLYSSCRQIPRENGVLRYSGYVGGGRSIEDGKQAARLCALNALSAVRQMLGSLDRIRQIVKLTGFVASAAGFTDQPKVVDGASVFLVELFGDRGKHARAAVGVNELPLGSLVEVEMIIEVESEPRP